MRRPSIVGILALSFMAVSIGAFAQVPPPPVPAASELANTPETLRLKARLDARFADLQNLYDSWNSAATSFNSDYAGKSFDEGSAEARAGMDAQSRVQALSGRYQTALAAYQQDLARLARRPTIHPVLPRRAKSVIDGLNAEAARLGWDRTKRDRLDLALRNLDLDKSWDYRPEKMGPTWRAVRLRGSDAGLTADAKASGQSAWPAGAGLQANDKDCALFALANAAERPYGFVAARAAELMRHASWRTAAERSAPEETLTTGLNGGEVIMLAEILGEARTANPNDFTAALARGRAVMLNVGVGVDHHQEPIGHQVVLTRSFTHAGETWFEVMDSGEGATGRLYLSEAELHTVMLENGIVYSPEKNTTAGLLH